MILDLALEGEIDVATDWCEQMQELLQFELVDPRPSESRSGSMSESRSGPRSFSGPNSMSTSWSGYWSYSESKSDLASRSNSNYKSYLWSRR